MTHRERTLTALHHGETDRPPFIMSLCASQIKTMKLKLGTSDVYKAFEMDVKYKDPVFFEENPKLKSSKYYRKVSNAQRVNEWGIGFNPGVFHFESMIHPLADFDDENDAIDYPMPLLKMAPDAKAMITNVQQEGYACVGTVAPVGGTVFWPPYKLRGMEQILCDMVINPGYAEILYDRVTDLCTEMTSAMVESGVDILWLADDFGTQRDLMISLDMWRKWFKNRLARIISRAKEKNPHILVALHSDGKIDDIIPELIDIGLDILNPLQPECMDPADIKKRYGERLAFWGGVGTQTTMPFGNPQDVRETVRSLINTVGHGGGLLVAPTHIVEPEVPWDNIMALADEVTCIN